MGRISTAESLGGNAQSGASRGSDDFASGPVRAFRDSESSVATFLALFAWRARASPHEPAFFDVSFEGQNARAQAHSWFELDSRARRAASHLADAGIRTGDRVVLCLLNPSRFLSFFLGAQMLGAVPVPLPSAADLKGRNAFRDRVDSAIADCTPKAMVVDTSSDVEKVACALTQRVTAIDASMAAADLGPVTPPAHFSLERCPDEIAYIQYTSGSTGSPKGVLVTHANLMANLRAIARGAALDRSDVGFNWLPLYHDMGLVGGLLLGLFVGGGAYMMPTRTFIGAPTLWLRAMSHFKATFASAPNFAFNLLARHISEDAIATLDLSHWRRAFNGAEPIDRVTVDEFVQRFAAAGFKASAMCPVYGLAESTLAVSIPEPDKPARYDYVDREIFSREGRAVPVGSQHTADALSFVSVGRPVPQHRVRVLEPNGENEVGERCVGEVVVIGPSVTPGYFHERRPHGVPRHLRTGDLGYIADGEIFIVDRLKDLLIVGGRNIVPSDVERIVARVPGIRRGAVVAFGIRGANGTDGLCLVVGASQRAIRDPGTRAAIKLLVRDYFSLTPSDVLLVEPSLVPRTSSGKVQRSTCRDLYQRGLFESRSKSSAPA